LQLFEAKTLDWRNNEDDARGLLLGLNDVNLLNRIGAGMSFCATVGRTTATLDALHLQMKSIKRASNLIPTSLITGLMRRRCPVTTVACLTHLRLQWRTCNGQTARAKPPPTSYSFM
jgi:hypothetical protein